MTEKVKCPVCKGVGHLGPDDDAVTKALSDV